jgi:hypothetical protein
MPEKKKKKIAKPRYRKIEIKVSPKQKSLLDRFCKIHKTTTKRLVKRALRDYLERYASNPEDQYYISPNQLKLFEEEVVEYEGFVSNAEVLDEVNYVEPVPKKNLEDELGGLFSKSIRPDRASG